MIVLTEQLKAEILEMKSPKELTDRFTLEEIKSLLDQVEAGNKLLRLKQHRSKPALKVKPNESVSIEPNIERVFKRFGINIRKYQKQE